MGICILGINVNLIDVNSGLLKSKIPPTITATEIETTTIVAIVSISGVISVIVAIVSISGVISVIVAVAIVIGIVVSISMAVVSISVAVIVGGIFDFTKAGIV